MGKNGLIYRYKQSWISKRSEKVVYLVLLAGFFLLSPGQNLYTVFGEHGKQVLWPLPVAIPSPAPYPVNSTGYVPGAEITATGVVVYDVDSGIYLLRRSETERFSPASTTKVLTALVALDAYGLDDVVTVREVRSNGQVMGLVPGERITVENLLFGTLIASGNDAAFALADTYLGGVEKFVEAMNTKANELHLADSHFTNPVGYDDLNHKMTPIDLTKLAVAALTNKTVAKMVAIPQITVSDVTHTYFHALRNVNALLGKIPGVGGIKTGWTEEAGENLVTLVERNGHRVVIVVLKSQNRFEDTSRIIDWIFANHRWEVPAPPTE